MPAVVVYALRQPAGTLPVQKDLELLNVAMMAYRAA